MAFRVRKLLACGLAGYLPGGQKECVLCNQHVWRYMPYERGGDGIAPLMDALSVVGSNVEQFECPRCGSTDRERHVSLYMRASGVLGDIRGSSVLHFAPEKHLSKLIRDAAPSNYVRCDLYPSSVDVQRVDMQRIPFGDESFDLVIANHVLEHVDDLSASLREINRVLKPKGAAILQTPYSPVLEKTWSDSGINEPSARLHAYGQEDHVRLFGADIFRIIVSNGFDAEIGTHADLLLGVDAGRVGVNEHEPFFYFKKTASLG